MQKKNKAISIVLKKMDQETKELRSKDSADPSIMIRQNQYTVVLMKFSDILQEFKSMQTAYQARVEERLARHIKIVKPDATPMEIEKAILGEKIFAPQSMLQRYTLTNSKIRTEAKEALLQIERKKHDVNMLLDSILELNQLFVDVSVLISAQVPILN